MVATGYVDCNAPLAVFLITTAIAFAGISFAGWAVNHLDLAPPYAGQNHDIHVAEKKQLNFGARIHDMVYLQINVIVNYVVT